MDGAASTVDIAPFDPARLGPRAVRDGGSLGHQAAPVGSKQRSIRSVRLGFVKVGTPASHSCRLVVCRERWQQVYRMSGSRDRKFPCSGPRVPCSARNIPYNAERISPKIPVGVPRQELQNDLPLPWHARSIVRGSPPIGLPRIRGTSGFACLPQYHRSVAALRAFCCGVAMRSGLAQQLESERLWGSDYGSTGRLWA